MSGKAERMPYLANARLVIGPCPTSKVNRLLVGLSQARRGELMTRLKGKAAGRLLAVEACRRHRQREGMWGSDAR